MGSEYAFRIRGRLSPDVVAALHPLEEAAPLAVTVLRGEVEDQAALHGLIARLEQLGLELVGLERTGPGHRSGNRLRTRVPQR